MTPVMSTESRNSKFSARQSIIYYGSGTPHDPSSGMDVVLREHLLELRDSGLEISTRVVARKIADDTDPFSAHLGLRHRQFLADDLAYGPSVFSPLSKALHVLRGKALMSIGYVSREARMQFLRDMKSNPRILIIDHLQSLVNLSLFRVLLLRKTKVVYICHNFTPRFLIDDAVLSKSWVKKTFLWIQSVQILIIESLLIWKASACVFISDADKSHYDWIARNKSTTLCPAPKHRKDEVGGENRFADWDLSRMAVFIGSPKFPPNGFAVRWLVSSLAPELRKAGSAVRVLLVGSGTQASEYNVDDHVLSAGFVRESELSFLLSNCLCLISPVVHGSGLKIKLLDAFSHGCPVIATRESLEGYEFMDCAPGVVIDEPRNTVDILSDMLAGRGTFSKEKVKAMWEKHSVSRKGALKRLLLDLFVARPGRESTDRGEG